MNYNLLWTLKILQSCFLIFCGYYFPQDCLSNMVIKTQKPLSSQSEEPAQCFPYRYPAPALSQHLPKTACPSGPKYLSSRHDKVICFSTFLKYIVQFTCQKRSGQLLLSSQGFGVSKRGFLRPSDLPLLAISPHLEWLSKTNRNFQS